MIVGVRMSTLVSASDQKDRIMRKHIARRGEACK